MIELHGIQCAFGFSNKVDVLDCALIERNRPVGRIVAYRCRNMESLWQLGIYCHFLCCIYLTNKLALALAIREYIVYDTFLSFKSFIYRSMFLLRKDVTVKHSFYSVVTDMLYNDCGFLLQYQPCYLADKLFRICLIHAELRRTYFGKYCCHSLSCQTCRAAYLAQQVITHIAYNIRFQLLR